MGGKFQNSFETPTVLGILGSVVGRVTGAVYTSTEGYSDSTRIKRPFLVPKEQTQLFLDSSLFLLNVACCHRLLSLVKFFPLR